MVGTDKHAILDAPNRPDLTTQRHGATYMAAMSTNRL